ncbi:unnamed protein product [Caenorhabditis angaria]|uniref:Uncharacterized protein n=1 Tax=Caenorhabditis angaria TaxID=860376 RepID=A0A9P1IKN9_9PELO|nr:unnamed protein product [Caenorhabditis angaria]
MNSNVELSLVFKIAIIAVGVIHVIFGFTALVQAIREAIVFADTMDKHDKLYPGDKRKGFGKEATIAPAFFLPLVAGAVCIVFAFISRFFIIFIIIAAELFAAILYIVALARIHGFFGNHGTYIDGQIKKPPKDFAATLKSLDAVLSGNLALAYIGFFFTLASLGLSGYLAYYYWPWGEARDSGGNELKSEKKSTCEVQDA